MAWSKSVSFPQDAEPTLAEQAYQKIRRRILDTTFQPGAVISERLLSEHLNMGKAPIRAALIRLAADGFVTIASRQGIVITTQSIEDILELFQVRRALELMIVQETAGRLNPDQIDQLQQNLVDYGRIAETSEPVESIDVDFEFHRLLAEFHGNRRMTQILTNVFDSLYREIRKAQVKHPNRIWSSQEEHHEIAKAIIEGQSQLASELMKSHLRFGEEFLLSRARH